MKFFMAKNPNSSAKKPLRVLLGVFSALIVLTSLVGAGVQAWFGRTVKTVSLENVLSSPSPVPTATPTPIPEPTLPATLPQGNPINILLIGSDTRQGQGKGYGSAETITGARSDSTIILHINSTHTQATALSIPRDLWVTIPPCPKPDGTYTAQTENRFNSAFSTGGAECTILTLNLLTGIPINNAIIIDFKGFKKIINKLDGIQVCLKEPVKDSHSKLNLPAGPQTINGKQALALARARYNIGDGSDLSRISRQHQLIKSIVRQVQTQNILENPKKFYDITEASLQTITVDQTLSNLNDFSKLILTASRVPLNNIEFITWPNTLRSDKATLSPNIEEGEKISTKILTDILPINTKAPSSMPVEPKNKNNPCKGYIAID